MAAPWKRGTPVLLLLAAILAAGICACMAEADHPHSHYISMSRAGIPRSLVRAFNPARPRPDAVAAGSWPANDWFAPSCWGGMSQPAFGWQPVCYSSPGTVAAAESTYTPPEEFYQPHYKQALNLNFLFYEAQRSGKLPANNRIKWRTDAFVNDRVPGGYHDAGDTIKHSLTIGYTVMNLAWSALEFPQGYAQATQLQNLRAAVKWGADYLFNCHISADEFVGLIGDANIDHNYWGRPEDRPPELANRTAYIWDLKTQAASDLLGSTVAGLTAASLLFRPTNAAYADKLLAKAQLLYAKAKAKPGKYWESHPEYKAMGEPIWLYLSSDWRDNMMVAAAWMYRATRNESYLADAHTFYTQAGGRWDISVYCSWDDMYPVATTLLLGIGKEIGADKVPGHAEYKDFMDNTFLSSYYKADDTWGVVKTPKGFRLYSWSIWGNTCYSANVAYLALVYAKQLPFGRARENAIRFAKGQIDYMLGSAGKSFLVGFGPYYPQQPHHAMASCPDRPAPCGWEHYDSMLPNPQVLLGALVAGPTGCNVGAGEKCGDTEGQPKSRFDNTHTDVRNDYISNEMTVSCNSGLSGALAGLIQWRA